MDNKRNNMPQQISLQKAIELIPFVQGLPPASIVPAFAHAGIRNHPINQTILLENDWGSSVYFVIDGWIKIRTYNSNGREITLNIVGKGEMLGEMAALEQVPRSTDVVTLAPATIVNIPADDFIRLLETEPLAGIRLAKLVAKRLRQVNHRLRLRESNSASRVADTLLFLVERQGELRSHGMEIPHFPHREISGISGLTRETVTRVLAKMETTGLISRTTSLIIIPDLDALKASVV